MRRCGSWPKLRWRPALLLVGLGSAAGGTAYAESEPAAQTARRLELPRFWRPRPEPRDAVPMGAALRGIGDPRKLSVEDAEAVCEDMLSRAPAGLQGTATALFRLGLAFKRARRRDPS